MLLQVFDYFLVIDFECTCDNVTTIGEVLGLVIPMESQKQVASMIFRHRNMLGALVQARESLSAVETLGTKSRFLCLYNQVQSSVTIIKG